MCDLEWLKSRMLVWFALKDKKCKTVGKKKEIGVEASEPVMYLLFLLFPVLFFLSFFAFLVFFKDRWIEGKFCTDSGGG